MRNKGEPLCGRWQDIWLSILFLAVGCTQNPGPLVAVTPTPTVVPAPTLTVQIANYSPVIPGNVFANLFVSNFSVVLRRGTASYSSARDGLSDDLKTNVLHNALSLLTNGPITSPFTVLANQPYSDYFSYLTGVNLNTMTNPPACPSMCAQNANPLDGFCYLDARSPNPTQPVYLGLSTCEKGLLGLSTTTFDTDQDGIPDYLEFRCGLNPKNPNDATLNSAVDMISNTEKCKRNIPIDESSTSAANQKYAYQYTTNLTPAAIGSPSPLLSPPASQFTVSNIPLVNLSAGGNFIGIYLVENNPSTHASSLYTAYAIVTNPGTLSVPYWASTQATNFQIKDAPQ